MADSIKKLTRISNFLFFISILVIPLAIIMAVGLAALLTGVGAASAALSVTLGPGLMIVLLVFISTITVRLVERKRFLAGFSDFANEHCKNKYILKEMIVKSAKGEIHPLRDMLNYLESLDTLLNTLRDASSASDNSNVETEFQALIKEKRA